MATYLALKTRIIAETNRDDLADDYAQNLTDAITQAIDEFATRRFWFNEYRNPSVAMTSGNALVTLPTGLRAIDAIWANIGAGYRIEKTSLDYIEDLVNVGGNGQPTLWAYYAPSGSATLKFWPTPNSAYTLTIIGTKDETALSADGSTNAWTTYAYDLIAAKAKEILCRDLFRDEGKRQTAADAVDRALRRLARENTDRLATGRMAPAW